MDFKKIIREEIEDFKWIEDIEPSKWDLFQEIIKDKPNINIQINPNNDGWYGFTDENGMQYYDYEFSEEFGLDEDIKNNDMTEYLNALSQFIETTFEGEVSKDYEDFKELESTLEYVITKFK